MEIVEVVRRWPMGRVAARVARGNGVARETVKKYLRATEWLCLAAKGQSCRYVEAAGAHSCTPLRTP
ncbi:MAG: hypothetical protein JOZ65_20115 [Chloroflexi bacterium]|nr:hypothetical protein [Chloroflexota bacterium]